MAGATAAAGSAATNLVSLPAFAPGTASAVPVFLGSRAICRARIGNALSARPDGMIAPEPRQLGPGCGRPPVAWVRTGKSADAPRVAVGGACFCDRITVLPTRTRILILQHPREQYVAIGTARMAHRALPNSRLRVGLRFAEDSEVLAALADSPSTYVLFPGPSARSIRS